MKTTLKQFVVRLPLVGPVVARRNLLRKRLRTLLGALRGRSPAGAARHCLQPLFTARGREDFLDASRAHLADIAQRDAKTLQAQRAGSFRLRRFCLCCNEATWMAVDYEHFHPDGSGGRMPNWREKLVCAGCGMNNRQRLVAKLAQQAAQLRDRPSIYLMEQVTPIFEWAGDLPGAEVHGSEYLGPHYRGGEWVQGVRHEDAMALSYADGSFDLIVSNDVLEHIPDPARALRECCRVLKPGGTLLATFPFHVKKDSTVTRARLVGDAVEHLLPPEYHGNPLSSGGSLVFHDFGWDLLETMRAAGFSSAACELYSSDEFGHLGGGLLVFRLGKTRGAAAV